MALLRLPSKEAPYATILHSAQCFLLKRVQTLAEDSINRHSELEVRPVSPEILEVVSRRNLSIISLSPYITDGIQKALLASAKSSKAIRKSSFALTDRLKESSRSKHRGGLNDLTILGGSDRLKTANHKAPNWKVTAQHIRALGLMDVSDSAAEQLEEDFAPLREGDAPPRSRVLYDSSETVGYAAARLPGCYSVVWRVLDEIDVRVPDFQPRSMLDFGAGPGTAIWAASEIWDDSLNLVHAVEPSEAMRWLGIQIEQQSKSSQQDNKLVASDTSSHHLGITDSNTGCSWHDKEAEDSSKGFSPPTSDVREPIEAGSSTQDALTSGHEEDQQGDGDLLDEKGSRDAGVDSLVIGEGLSSPLSNFGRTWSIRWLQHMHGFGDRKKMGATGPGAKRKRTGWVQSTGGRKYDLVVASYSFGELTSPKEQRQALKAMWQATDKLLVIIEPGTPSGSGLVRAARQQILDWETGSDGKKNAHVVAPCPHDGQCPMDGIESWCHFSQRYERPKVQRLAKIRHGHALPRSYQDERFSYIVLRKGARPQPATEVATPDQIELLKGIGYKKVEKMPGPKLTMPNDDGIQELIRMSLHPDDEDEDDLDWDSSETISSYDPQPENTDRSKIKVLNTQKTDTPGSQSSEDTLMAAMESQTQETVSASNNWSRIVRRPRKRTGHVIVDVCTAAGPPSNRQSSGALLQQVIARSERKKHIGPTGFRIAKRLGWGDLWPTLFQQYAVNVKEHTPEMLRRAPQ